MGVNVRSAVLTVAAVMCAVTPLLGPAQVAAAPGDIGVRYAWGYNATGDLGNGTWDDTDVPVQGSWGAVPLADQLFTDVAISDNSIDAFGCGVAGGKAYCWGSNSYGQLGNDSLDDSSPLPVAVDRSGVLASKTLVSVTAGRNFACALDTQGRAYCWGRNDVGQLGSGSVSALSRVPVAVDRTGVLAGTTLEQISSGQSHTCVRDVVLYCWGGNAAGQLGDGANTSSNVPVAVTMAPIAGGSAAYVTAGGSSSCALSAGGIAYCWGDNSTGQLGNGTWGGANNSNIPTPVDSAGVLNGRALDGISISLRNACAWDDSAYCWGVNNNGQLGFGALGSPWESFTPAAVSTSGALSGKDIDQVSVGAYSACALDAGGVAYCWGAYWNGRLGMGPVATDQFAPVAVSGGRTYAVIAVGDGPVAAITGPLAYTVTYDANQATSGTPPPPGSGPIDGTFTVAANSGNLARTGYAFTGWNTLANGNGTGYTAGSGTFTLTGNTTLYAAWRALPPPPQPPGSPYLREARPSNRAVTLVWLRPDLAGTSPVNDYRVYAAPGGQVCTVRAATYATYSCEVSGLLNGKPYEFWVTAISDAGESAPSRRLTATPRPDRPERPNFTSLIGGNEQATARWEPPTDDGGAPITAYHVYSSAGGRLCTVDATAGPPYGCTITGLRNFVSYQLWVTAVNEAGESPQSRWLSVIPTPVRPSAPRDVAGLAVEYTIRFAWKPPLDAGSYPVEFYQLLLEPGGVACTVQAPETSCTVEGLKPGATYRGRVRAYSKAGYGPTSDLSTAITVPFPPPQGISVEVRRARKDPDLVRVKGQVTRIKPGTALWVWIHRENDEYGYWESFQGDARPVVQPDGTFTWERKAPVSRTWEVNWCTGPGVTGSCSPWTLLVDPTG